MQFGWTTSKFCIVSLKPVPVRGVNKKNRVVFEINKFDIMETILGIKGPDFVMLAADCTQAHSIITLKEGIKWIEMNCVVDFVYSIAIIVVITLQIDDE